MKRFSFIIPIMLIVAILAMWLLNKNHSQVPFDTRILIAAGGSIVSGIIAFFLLRSDVHKIDPKPNTPNNKKR